MITNLKNFVRIEYNFAKKTDRYDIANSHFHNAYGAICFATFSAETSEQYNEIVQLWDEWKEKFEAVLWNISA